MNMNNQVPKEMRDALRAPLPDEAITPHPTKSYLSSIKAIYVTERMNDVFGIGGWRYKVEKISENQEGMVVVKVIYEVPEYGVYYESFGGNDNGGTGNKNFDLGDAYKGATTDALTKIGSYLEIGIDVFKGKHGTKKPAPSNNKAASEKQIMFIASLWKEVAKAKQWTDEEAKAESAKYIGPLGSITANKASEVIKKLQAKIQELNNQS